MTREDLNESQTNALKLDIQKGNSSLDDGMGMEMTEKFSSSIKKSGQQLNFDYVLLTQYLRLFLLLRITAAIDEIMVFLLHYRKKNRERRCRLNPN